jgi:8-oxo-dGTP diphosphatase
MEINKFTPPLKVKVIGDRVITSFGNWSSGGFKLKDGYTYRLRVSYETIIEIAQETVDILIWRHTITGRRGLFIKRRDNPYKGEWALPGGFVDELELPIEAAVRELREETGIKLTKKDLKQISVNNEPWRDPRLKWTLSTSFLYITDEPLKAQAGDDAAEVAWLDIDEGGVYLNSEPITLAFDHLEIVKKGLENE